MDAAALVFAPAAEQSDALADALAADALADALARPA